MKVYGLKKTEFNNKILHAKRRMNMYLKSNGYPLSPSQKLIDRVFLFRLLTNEAPFLLSKKEANQWLLEIWEDGNNEIVHKNDSFSFYLSSEWRSLRKKVLKYYSEECMKCKSRINLCIDHILPRSLYPEFQLVFDNLQVLCIPCNSSKSNKNFIDYRPKSMVYEEI